MQSDSKPDFIVVGAAKSGTTSLFHYLNEHPDIYIPAIKECRFFSQLSNNYTGLGAETFPNGGIRDEKEYFSLFERNTDKVCGDISNDYLYYHAESIANIKKYLSDEVKIIIILRNPVDRAYSNYLHALREGWEKGTFEEDIIRETYRMKNHWAWPYHYVHVGMYYKQVKAYLENFKNVRIFLYDDLKHHQRFMDDLFDFIGVGPYAFDKKTQRHNVSGYPRSQIASRFLLRRNSLKSMLKPLVKLFVSDRTVTRIMQFIKTKNLEKKAMDPATRLYLQEIFSEDIENLARLTGKDLSGWTK